MKKALVLAACLALLAAGAAQAALLQEGVSYPIEIGSANWIPMTYLGIDGELGGGSFDPATLGGVSLSYIYCVDLSHVLGGTKPYTASFNRSGTTENNGLLTPDAARRIAWLLTEYGSDADVNGSALQASIWHQLNPWLGMTAGTEDYGTYAAYTFAVNGADVDPGLVDNFYWLTLRDKNTRLVQGMVAYVPTPLPGTLMLLGSGLIGLVGVARFRRHRAAS